MCATLSPSMTISPSAASRIRNRQRVMEDLPAPVRPTMPTCGAWVGHGKGCQWHFQVSISSQYISRSSQQGLWQCPQAQVPSPHPAHEQSRSSAPTRGQAGTALNSSGTPPFLAWASLPGRGCSPPPRGPRGRRLDSSVLIQVIASKPSRTVQPHLFQDTFNPRPPWSLGGRPGTLWFSESLHPLTFFHRVSMCQASMLSLGHTL
jgi:hypothetical protein